MKLLHLLGLFAAGIASVTAQTFTNCNPLNSTCPADPALGTNHTFQLNKTLDSNVWTVTSGTVDQTRDGAQFAIVEKMDSPTMQSNFYIFFGVVETFAKMATGRGVVSSVVLESDDLDEIDWEWVGYNTSGVQSNYYGKGNHSSYDRAGYHYVENADSEFHNYTTYWTHEKLEWWIDGQLVRTLNYEDALGGKNFPQTPCNVRIGIWPAGDPSQPTGTIEWAGGEVDYDKSPYVMTVQSVRVQDFSTGKEYSYGDQTGDWQSIKITEGNSTIKNELLKPHLSVSERWKNLSSGAKAGVGIGIAVFIVAVIVAITICCVVQRKKGRAEYAAAMAKFDNDRKDILTRQKTWRAPPGNGWQHVPTA
ncbi:hypothetical protein MPDQ_008000 [Monascus purpureus]|uniref:chitinase n=1 Tax=Monascus purpureus TaxID=5098 RepID=A0A507QST7_MONPU|nr:hypothetical protein MPDQ_008000 [Monascus purpureus]BDD62458.1 hypothetical protein MAP00_007425 [Monascus purpureus]